MRNSPNSGLMCASQILSLLKDNQGFEFLETNFLTTDILMAAVEHVLDEYGGVVHGNALVAHAENYILLGEFASQWRSLPCPEGPLTCNSQLKVVDIGCGFGSFALGAASQGAEVLGIEMSPALIEIAAERAASFPKKFQTLPKFLVADARDLPLENASIDLVTAWNVIEHVDDLPKVVSEVARVLRPGGWLTLVAPNYLAVRKEAHYLVPWLPMLPKRFGKRYLRALGRDPKFLETNIWYRTRPDVRARLRREFSLVLTTREVRSRGLRLNADTDWQRPGWRPAAAAVDVLLRVEALNPLGRSIVLCARKDCM